MSYRIIYNKDQEFVAEMKQALKNNNGFCPCKLDRNKDTKCICKEFKEQDEGFCSCGLYQKIKK